MVLEVVGGEVFKKSIQLLKPFGRLVVIGFASINFKKYNPITWLKTCRDAPKANVLAMAQRSFGVSASHIGYLIDKPQVVSGSWSEMIMYITKHNLKPHVGKIFDFDQMHDAHEYMESRKSTGKVLIRVFE